MKVRTLLAVSIMLSAAYGQWLEATIEVGREPRDICYNTQDNKLYCSSYAESLGLLVIDGATNTVTDTVPIAGRGQGCELCYNPIGNEVYWTVHFPRWNIYLFAVDGSTNVMLDTVGGEGYGSRMCHNGTSNKLYVEFSPPMMIGMHVLVYDCATLELLASIYAGDWSGAQVLCHNPAVNKAYANVYGGYNHLMIIDGAGDSVLRTLPTAQGGVSACFSPLGKVYVGRDSSVCVVDGAGDSLLRTIPVPGGAQLACYDSIDTKLYCAGNQAKTVTVVDCTADTVLTEVSTYRPISALLYEPLYNNVYCISQDSGDVTVIDCSEDTVLVTIGVGGGPSAFCCNPEYDRVYVANADDSTIAVIRAGPVGVEERIVTSPAQPHGLFARDVLDLGGQATAELLDISGRKLVELEPGINDIRHVAPGVYLARQKQTGHTTRVIVTR